jgi:hypothetical protein
MVKRWKKRVHEKERILSMCGLSEARYSQCYFEGKVIAIKLGNTMVTFIKAVLEQ